MLTDEMKSEVPVWCHPSVIGPRSQETARLAKIIPHWLYFRITCDRRQLKFYYSVCFTEILPCVIQGVQLFFFENAKKKCKILKQGFIR